MVTAERVVRDALMGHKDWRALAALGALEDEVRALRGENARYVRFVAMLVVAYQEHLRTGDYAKLGMETQDVLRALQEDR